MAPQYEAASLTQPLTTSFTNASFHIRPNSHLDAQRPRFGSTVVPASYVRLTRSGMDLSAVNALGPSGHQKLIGKLNAPVRRYLIE